MFLWFYIYTVMWARLSLVTALLLVLAACTRRLDEPPTEFDAARAPLDVVLLLDQSGSMMQNDPTNNRVEASRALVDYLASYWSEEQNHRVGLVNFGDTRPIDPVDEYAPLVSLDTQRLAERDELLRRIKPLDLGNTSFIGAFRVARRLLEESRRDEKRQPVLVLLTDGEPDDSRDLTRAAYFDELTRYLRDSLSGCHLYVLGIDQNDRYWSRNEPYWRQSARYSQRLVSADERLLKEMFWQVVSLEMEAVADSWQPIPPDGFRVTLPPYLEAVTFAFHKETSGAAVEITGPDNKVTAERTAGVRRVSRSPRTEVWRIDEPEAGTWTCRVIGGAGRVEVGTTRVPVQPRLLYPAGSHPQGKPFAVRASFLRRDGRPVKQHVAHRLTMWADILVPGQRQARSFQLGETSQTGLYVSAETVATPVPGDYFVTLHMKAEVPVAETTFGVAVAPVPYLEVLAPRDGERQPWRKNLVVDAEVRVAGKTVNPKELFRDNPDAIVFCRVFDQHGEPVNSGHLRFLGGEKDARLGRGFGRISRNGAYRVELALNATTVSGSVAEYSTYLTPVFVTRRQDALDFVLGRWYLLIALALFCVLVWDWQRIGRENGWWGWRINLPRLRGRLSVEAPGSAPATQRIAGRKQKFATAAGCEITVYAVRVHERGKRYSTDAPMVQATKPGGTRHRRVLTVEAAEQLGELIVRYTRS
jgi:uncharacterized protein YegL